MSHYEWTSVTIQALTLLAIFLYTRYSRHMLTAMLDANKRAEEANGIANKPWILLERIDPIPVPEAGKPLPSSFGLHFRNFGGGVAVSADLSAWTYVAVESDDPAAAANASRPQDGLPTVAIGPGQSIDFDSANLVAEWSEKMAGGRDFLRVAGEVRTVDIFGQTQTIAFGQYLQPDGTWRPSAHYGFWQQAQLIKEWE